MVIPWYNILKNTLILVNIDILQSPTMPPGTKEEVIFHEMESWLELIKPLKETTVSFCSSHKWAIEEASIG